MRLAVWRAWLPDFYDEQFVCFTGKDQFPGKQEQREIPTADLKPDTSSDAEACAAKLADMGVECPVLNEKFDADVHRPCQICENKHVICRHCVGRLPKPECPYCRKKLDVTVLSLCELLEGIKGDRPTLHVGAGGRRRRRRRTTKRRTKRRRVTLKKAR